MNLSRADLETFARLGIGSGLLERAGIERVSDAEARSKYGITGSSSMDAGGVVFPYVDPLTEKRHTARIRRDRPEIEDGKPRRKYLSAYGDRRHLYLVPGCAELVKDASTPIVLVEAEKSVLALTAWAARMERRILPVGLGGCWGWRGRIGKRQTADGVRVDEVGPLPELLTLCSAGRVVYVLLDSNATSNEAVQQARNTLVGVIQKQKAQVHVLNLPRVRDVNGPDDYIAIRGDAALAKLVDSAKPYKPHTRDAEVIDLDRVQARAVSWLWRPYIARGELTTISGDPSAGKTFVTLAIAASLTCGRIPYCGEPCLPVDVLYMSTENSPECVLRPRFDSLEGNASRFHLLLGSITTPRGNGHGPERGHITLADVDVLDEALDRTNSSLLIVDPIQSYLGAKVDMHRANEVRPIMDGLAHLAAKHQAAILIVRHFAKATGGHAIHRGLGSVDLTGVVRSEIHVGSVDGERAFVHVKNNLGPHGDGLGFAIEADGNFRWTGKTEITAEDLGRPEKAEDHFEIERACQYLEEQLANGPKLAKELEEGTDINVRTLQRACRKLNLEKSRNGRGGPWTWALGIGDNHA